MLPGVVYHFFLYMAIDFRKKNQALCFQIEREPEDK